MPTTLHGKYPPPPMLEAPPELERLVAAHLASEGREWGRSLLEIRSWFIRNKVRKYTVFLTERHIVNCDDSPRIGDRFVYLKPKER